MPPPQRTFKNSNTPNSNINRPKPKIEKIELSEEDKENIKTIMSGRPPKKLVQRWLKEGVSMHNAEKYYNPPSLEGRLKFIRQKYFNGLCHICQKFPLYKVSYKMGTAALIEYYCEQCFSRMSF